MMSLRGIFVTLLFFSLGVFLSPLLAQAGTLAEEEISVLIDLYHSSEGDGWNWNRDGSIWNVEDDISSLDPCEEHWQGVECSCKYNDYYHQYAYNYYYYSGASYDTSNCTVVGLNLPLFNLQGSLPRSLKNLTNLEFLHLPGNTLHGTVLDIVIPALTKLTILGLSNNRFTGTIPESIDQLQYLYRINLRYNKFSGSVPDSIKNLDLIAFDSSFNHFTGTFPNGFSIWKYMIFFDLTNNFHTGRFDYVFDTPLMQQLKIFANHFTGPLPDLTSCINLINLNLGGNDFTGRIPLDTWTNSFPKMWSLGMSTTNCFGTIPSSISNFHDLKFLDFGQTPINGSLPEEIGQLTELKYLYLSQTALSHTIPASIGNLKKLLIIELGGTDLTGSLPNSIGSFTKLRVMDLKSASFSGTIPKTIANLKSLNHLLLQHNEFTGEIPFSVFTFPQLTILQLQNNQFSRISKPTNTSASSTLRIVDLSSNLIEGSLYPEVFVNESQLKIFAAVRNCFTYFDLEQVCQAKNLTVFSIDGIHSACSKQMWSYYPTLPSCLMTLPRLHFLHMAEVHLIGSIPEQISPSLVDLSLAHNSLSGTIPRHLQEQSWKSIDLSFNKLTGDLLKNNSIANDTSTKFQVNRLSGIIPSNLREVSKLSILDGNIFDCEFITRRSLPAEDPDYDIYSCGTNSLNVLLYLWYAFFVLTILYYGVYHGRMSQFFANEPFQSFKDFIWMKLECEGHAENVFQLYLQWMVRIFVFGGVLAAIVLLPVYLILNHFWKTYEYTYAFQVSSIYMSGVGAAVILAILWLGMTSITSLYTQYMSTQCLQKVQSSTQSTPSETLTFSILFQNHRWLACKFIALNLLVFGIITAYIIAINIGFIYSQTNYGPTIAVYCQIALATIKLITNQIIIPLLIKVTFHEARMKKLHSSRRLQLQWFRRLQLRMEIFLAMISNIISPCIAAAVSSSTCYYYAIFPPEEIKTTYIMEGCAAILVMFIDDTVRCTKGTLELIQTSFRPSFEYSYHCSSFLISHYSSVYVYMYLLNTFIKPTVREYLGYFIKKYVKREKPNQIQPREINVVPGSSSDGVSSFEDQKQIHSKKPLEKQKPSVLNKDDFVLQYIVSVSILLTFGLMFPPLFFIIAYYMTVTLKETEAAIIEAEVKIKLNPVQLATLRRDITVLFQDVNENMQWQVIPVMVVFCAYFLFDIIGDSYGWEAALALGLSYIAAFIIIYYVSKCREAKAVTPVVILPVAQSDPQAPQSENSMPTTSSTKLQRRKTVGIEDTTVMEVQQEAVLDALDLLDESEEQEETLYDLVATMIGAFFAI